jgi:hypothetical protein
VCDWLREQSSEDQAFFQQMAEGDKSKLLKACAAQGLEAEISTLRAHVRKRHTVNLSASDSDNEAAA